MTWRSEENLFAPGATQTGNSSGAGAASPPGRLSLRLESLRLPREPAAMAEVLQAAIGRAWARQYAAHPHFAGADGEGSPGSRQLQGLFRQTSLRLTETLQSRLAFP
jgi:hypothetical protein